MSVATLTRQATISTFINSRRGEFIFRSAIIVEYLWLKNTQPEPVCQLLLVHGTIRHCLHSVDSIDSGELKVNAIVSKKHTSDHPCCAFITIAKTRVLCVWVATIRRYSAFHCRLLYQGIPQWTLIFFDIPYIVPNQLCCCCSER